MSERTGADESGAHHETDTAEIRPTPYGVDLVVAVEMVPNLVMGEVNVPLPGDTDLSGFRLNDVIVDGDDAVFKFIYEADGGNDE